MVVEEKSYPTTLTLHPGLIRAIDSLPPTLDAQSDLDAYYDFLVTFGTHFISQETFGGKIEWQVYVGNATSQATADLEQLTQGVFDRLLSSSINTAMSGAELELQSDIPSISRTEFSVIGGQPTDGSFDMWAATVGNGADMVGRDNFLPEMIGVDLMSIAELAPSFSKRRLIAQAIDQWLSICLPPPGSNLAGAACSNQGICGVMTGRCMCDMGYNGDQCQLRGCPTAIAGKSCSGHGLCDVSSGDCACFHNQTTMDLLWTGDDCDQDVDECRIDRDICSLHNRECVNTPGSYYCDGCRVGYDMDDNGFCVDIDECEDATACVNVLSTCHNHDGSYSCIECHQGFGGLDCEDIDECARPNNECSVNNQDCVNTHGGFECSDCHAGYRMDANGFCIMENVCVQTEGPCGAFAECVGATAGLAGVFHCECHSGYYGDGHTCEPNGCVATTLEHAQGLCEGDFGDECELQCDGGYIASGPVSCMADGAWAGGSCLFECPHLTLTGDCFRIANQVYDLQPDSINGKAHYIGATIPLHIYYDGPDQIWLMDDDTDSVAIHAHMRSADTFPSGRRLWTSWCGPFYGWSEIIVTLSCSGMCTDTCADPVTGIVDPGLAHDGICDDGGDGDLTDPDTCAFGTDCDDCGTRLSDHANSCHESYDIDGHTCSQYSQMGYPCFQLIFVYGKDCSCSCPEFYGSNDQPETPAEHAGSADNCPCNVACDSEIVSFQDGEMICDCRGCPGQGGGR